MHSINSGINLNSVLTAGDSSNLNATISAGAIIDVDNDLSELTFYGQLPNETVNAEMDITNEQQNLIFNLNNIQTAGLFTMSICADDGTDLTCEGSLEAYFISDKNIKTVTYNCDENGENCSTNDQYLYCLLYTSDAADE